MHWPTVELWSRSTFMAINAGPTAPAWSVATAKVLANDLIYVVPLLLLIAWLWGGYRIRQAALRACVVTAVALGVGQMIGFAWPQPRPFVIHLGTAWMRHVADPSFPSDHVTVLSAVALCMLLDGEALIGALMFVGALCVGWARVYLGVHYPADVAGGLAVATIAYVTVAPMWQRLGVRLTDVVQAVYRRVFALPIGAGWVRA